ncbi:MAG: Re/Si-specific NAD(P)(+) transhydrogenase subunit alpha [Alphaproteobacteria bacterium]|nr:Re/Si-specific NAD(P)(+) transhydrogenase subunit alpha [Alphaproteobacteria bacterium]
MTVLAIIKETRSGESRVAASFDAVKKYVALGAKVLVERGAGAASSIADSDYEAAGATLVASAKDALSPANIVLKVAAPSAEEIVMIPEGATLVGMLEPFAHKDLFAEYNKKKIAAFSLEMLPRISRAQAMDVLSSQSNLAGYRAVVEAANAFGKVLPMMMTAAGTVPAAKTLILGAGVAGLQAIATAKRLGAIVSAFDVRTAAKEQVESLGAKFIEVKAEESGDAAGGYAKEMSDEYKRKQSELIAETIRKQDMVISTALIPGRPAPVLITEEMVKTMKPGSVIVDLAAASGGNCPLTEADKVVVKHGVILIGYTNMPSRVAVDASSLYSRNLYNFISTLLLPEAKWDDELVAGALLVKNGQTVHKQFI